MAIGMRSTKIIPVMLSEQLGAQGGHLPSPFAGFCLALISSLRSFPFFFLLFCVLLLHHQYNVSLRVPT